MCCVFGTTKCSLRPSWCCEGLRICWRRVTPTEKTTSCAGQDKQRMTNRDPHPRAPGALALSLTEAVDFLCFPQSRARQCSTFLLARAPKIKKIDSLWQGEGSGKAGRENNIASHT